MRTRRISLARSAVGVLLFAAKPLTLSLAVLFLARFVPAVIAGPSFVNWENAHVRPLAMTPDGTTLLAVNTPDARLEVFDLTGQIPIHVVSIPVGLDPVSVRCRTNDEVWVVNHISDSLSVVRLDLRNVVSTIATDDEPADVVFAGTPQRAFVSCSQVNRIQVFDPEDVFAAPTNLEIEGEDPRGLAVSPDGSKVYVAVFESGNRSTILGGVSAVQDFFPPDVVSHPSGPYGGQNPPPNDGAAFNPPMNPSNPSPPPVGLIVKKAVDGRWLDDNGGDWTEFVCGTNAGLSGRPSGWDLLDHDVAVLDTSTLGVSYIRGLMNICMAIEVNPVTGVLAVVGTDATNEIRFEPNLNGRFLRVLTAIVDPAVPANPIISDLNPHLTYETVVVPQVEREQSIGDPRGIVWSASGEKAYVAGMGSNNVIVIDVSGTRIGQTPTIEVGEGPTGLVLDESRGRLYVLNRFESSISVVNVVSEVEIARATFFDPTPVSVKLGREFHYDTHETSGLGHVACSSCHVDARMDRLAWDLGRPADDMIPFDQNCNFGSFGNPPASLGPPPCPDWHPIKGPMVTQTLQDIIGKEPHHWRGDRDGIEEFNQTFTNLQGRPTEISDDDMQALEDFLATIAFPPNPFRNINNSLPTNLPLPGHFFTGLGGAPGQPLPNGNASQGLGHFNNHHLMPGFGVSCSFCHKVPVGVATNNAFNGQTSTPFPVGPNGELHHAVVFSQLSETRGISIKVPQLRNLHEKVGFDLLHTTSRAGFGFMHDGSADTLTRFFSEPFFRFDIVIDGTPTQRISSMTAFMLAFSGSDYLLGQGIGNPSGGTGPLSNDTHAAVGAQVTVDGTNNNDPDVVALLDTLRQLADAGPDSTPGPFISLVAKGLQGLPRGFAYVGSGVFQSDRASETTTLDALRAAGEAGSEVTFTAVPRGTEIRIGIDRDEDGYLDRDELDACSDPADGQSTPGSEPGSGDHDGDGDVDLVDYASLAGCLAGPGQGLVTGSCACSDTEPDGDVDAADFAAFQAGFMP